MKKNSPAYRPRSSSSPASRGSSRSTSSLNPTGPNREKVYGQIRETVAEIPYGRVSTYGRIARLAGYARHARMVGYALHSLPADSDLPWHRVINAAGRISLSKDSDAYREQRQRLISEGVTFSGDKVDLTEYSWQPPLDELLWGEH